VAFTAARAGSEDIVALKADGGGDTNILAATPRNERVSDWSRDGKRLFYHTDDLAGSHLWYLERTEDADRWEPHVFRQTPFPNYAARVSPDGRFVAYLSMESGRTDVYVQPFLEGDGPRVTVSSKGGRMARWRPDGKELFYVEGQTTLIAVSVTSGASFSVESAARLFDHPGLALGRDYGAYDVSLDGQRFVLAEPAGVGADAPPPSIRVVQNWYEEFRDREQD
jgi:Tol biopolymer transport system component